MLRKLGFSQASVKSMVGSRYRPIPSLLKPIPQFHSCGYMEWDGDGDSPSECCDLCQHQMREYSIQAQKEIAITKKSFDPTKYATDGYSTWDEIQDARQKEADLYASGDVMAIWEIDIKRGNRLSWFHYLEIHEESRKTREEVEAEKVKYAEKFKAFKAKQEEFGFWYEPKEAEEKRTKADKDLKEYRDKLNGVEKVEMTGDAREYIRSVDRRKGEEKEAEFEAWLAIAKNKRPIYLEGGKMAPAVAKADIGSVVIKNCPPSVLLCDIRIVLARFGGVRDVYRPRDRASGKAKPFVFVEMLKNAEAWAAVDHFAANPFLLDGATFNVEGAGERKTSVEMAVIQPIKGQDASLAEVQEEVQVEQKKPKSTKATGAFSALMDSDSDEE